MTEKLILLCTGLLCLVAACSPALAAEPFTSGSSLPESPFQPYDDDPAIYNDCDYCHGLHNARRDTAAVLNDRQERYQIYLEPPVLSEVNSSGSVFDVESSHKCPRSRVKTEQ